MSKYNIETINNVIKLYNENKLNSREISELLNINQGTITYWIRKYSIPRQRAPKSKISNELYFDNIDNENKAYWLGWIMADGNISIYNNQYSLKLHIGIEDKSLIDRFLNEIGSTNKTKIKTNKYISYYVSLTSKHMINSLINLGVIPQKTGNEIMPNLRNDLISHFIRGYFDGDGITCNTEKNKWCGFISSYNLCESIQKELGTSFKIRIANNSKAYYFQTSKKSFREDLYKYMYSNASIYLKRKKERMDSICGNTEIIVETKESAIS